MKVRTSRGNKSVYRYLQQSGFISVKEFAFIRQGEKKYLLIRFVNDTSFQMNSIEYTVIQLDDRGIELKKTKQIKSGICVESGKEYTTQEGVVVEEKCSDVRVEIENFTSGSIKYRFENGGLDAEYIRILMPIVKNESIKKAKDKKLRLNVTEKKKKTSKKASAVAIVGYLFLLFAVFLAIFVELLEDTGII